MATTYLDITNEVLRELNEVPLTTSNFGNAKGLQAFVKDTVNKAIFDIAMKNLSCLFLVLVLVVALTLSTVMLQ